MSLEKDYQCVNWKGFCHRISLDVGSRANLVTKVFHLEVGCRNQSSGLVWERTFTPLKWTYISVQLSLARL